MYHIVFSTAPLPTVDVYSDDYLEEEDSEDVTNSWAITATVPTSKSKVLNLCYVMILYIVF